MAQPAQIAARNSGDLVDTPVLRRLFMRLSREPELTALLIDALGDIEAGVAMQIDEVPREELERTIGSKSAYKKLRTLITTNTTTPPRG